MEAVNWTKHSTIANADEGGGAVVVRPLTSHLCNSGTERYARFSLAQATFHKDAVPN